MAASWCSWSFHSWSSSFVEFKTLHFFWWIDWSLSRSTCSFLEWVAIIVRDQAPKCNITTTLVTYEILRIPAEWWIWLIIMTLNMCGVVTTWWCIRLPQLDIVVLQYRSFLINRVSFVACNFVMNANYNVLKRDWPLLDQ